MKSHIFEICTYSDSNLIIFHQRCSFAFRISTKINIFMIAPNISDRVKNKKQNKTH